MKKSALILFLLLSSSLLPAEASTIFFKSVSENPVKKQEAKTCAWGLVGALTALLSIKDIVGSYSTISVDNPEVYETFNEQAFEKLHLELAKRTASARLTTRDIEFINNATAITKKAAFEYMKKLIKLSHENETRAQFYRGVVFSLLSAYSFHKSYENYNELYNLKAHVSTQVTSGGAVKSSAQITLEI